jgi:DNA-binding LacI/PurR family transcriptional regulator
VAMMTTSIDDTVTQELTSAGIGVVFSNLCRADQYISNISVNYDTGVAQAIEHAAQLGHRRAAIMAGPEENRTVQMITRTLVSRLKRNGMSLCSRTNSRHSLEDAALAVKDILNAPKTPTVIFCGSDVIAMGAMSALEEAGVKIPEAMSIVGIDNISFAALARPSLTTINVPRENLGGTAFFALEKILQSKRHRGAEYSLKTELVVRKSTAPARSD